MRLNRREFVGGLGAAALTMAHPPRLHASAPAAPVALARCKSYGPEFLAASEKMFDQLGGLGRIVKGKTVTIKVNLTGGENVRLDYLPMGRACWSHPRTVGAVIHLLDKAGARRIRVVEGAWVWPASLEEFMYKAGWDPDLLLGAAPRVELVNTNMPYKGGKPYTRFPVPHTGHIFPAYDLSTAYAESDVLVSMTKLKEHATAGVTLSIKNLFGITPPPSTETKCLWMNRHRFPTADARYRPQRSAASLRRVRRMKRTPPRREGRLPNSPNRRGPCGRHTPGPKLSTASKASSAPSCQARHNRGYQPGYPRGWHQPREHGRGRDGSHGSRPDGRPRRGSF